MSKRYRPQRIGGSTYICIPPSFFTPDMLENGVRLILLRKGANHCIFKMEEVNEEHAISSEADREDASEFGSTADVREVNRPE